MHQDFVNLKALPTLTFSFVKWKHPHESIDINMYPQQYITHSGCSAQQVHLAFIKMPAHPHLSKALLKANGKFIRHVAGTKILGAPFLQNHLVIFRRNSALKTHYGNHGVIGFAKLHCQP